MKQINRNDFSYIKDRMIELNKSATDLARLINVETSTVTRIIKGEIKQPKFCIIVDIHKALKMPITAKKGEQTIKFK